MHSAYRSLLACVSVLLLALLPGLSQTALAGAGQSPAGQHVVTAAELQNAVAASARTREANEARIETFFGAAPARQSLKKAGMDYKVVQQAVPLLSNDELASLAARAEAAQAQFRAGSLTNQQITYIIIALATAVIILIIVER